MPSNIIDSRKGACVPVQDVYTVVEAAALLCISKNKIYELSKRSNDPFPLRRMPGYKRSGIVIREEMIEWAKRNYELVGSK